MAQLTTTDLKEALAEVRKDLTAKIESSVNRLRTDLTAKIDGSREELTESIRDLNTQFMQSQADQNTRLDHIDSHVEEVDTKVTAIMEMLATRKEVRALIRELKAQGIKLEESRIFAD